jgi:alkylation response protein AidB-like acyl-CoA dehydrogenase
MQVADKEKQKSMDLAEESREKEWKYPSFIAEMFKGKFRWGLVHPFPVQSPEDKKIGDEMILKAKELLERTLDPDKVDRTYEYPKEALKAMGEAGFFGMKIDKEYGGLGLSQTNYNRIVAFIGTYCQSTATWLSAHQSIGVPQPLKMMGTPEQKKKWLPRLAAGEISAFALTEPGVGSDPAAMKTRAVPSEDGKYYLITGEKLWITNGPDSDILIVMAQTPPAVIKGKERPQITAFVVDRKDPETAKGFEVAYRCRFMGLHGISNGLLRFTDMKVPAENIVGKTGEGLKIALMTLNTGRLTVPALSSAGGKHALHYAHKWCNTRIQWGVPIGKHQAVANMTSRMAAETFAMESINWLACALADKGGVDIRLEAAMAKYFCTEAGWRVGDDLMQVRSGRGYESFDSLRGRGEEPVVCERTMRDGRVSRILEGTSEIMQLIIAREATDMHMSKVMPIMNPKTPMGQKISMAFKALFFYATWFPTTFMPAFAPADVKYLSAKNRAHLAFVARTCKRLARRIFYPMAVYGPKLERKTLILARFVDAGTDLYAMAASLSRAEMLLAQDSSNKAVNDVVDLFCRIARRRIKNNFKLVWDRAHDNLIDKVGKQFLEGGLSWMVDGVYTDDPPKK